MEDKECWQCMNYGYEEKKCLIFKIRINESSHVCDYFIDNEGAEK